MSPAPAPTLLQLIWLASPALPVGGFSYSEGLEAAVDAGTVHDEASAAAWLLVQLELVAARAEAPLLAAAHEAWAVHDLARVEALNHWHHATRETAELRLQSEQMGRSLLEWLRNDPGAAADPRLATLARLSPAPAWPVAFALATARAGATARDAALAFGFGWAENLVQAAIKAVPLGQAAAQRILAALAAAMPAAVERALAIAATGDDGDTGDERRIAFAPMLAIGSARHEVQYSRLFRS